MSTECGKNGDISMSSMNFSGYVRHCDYTQLHFHNCVLFSSRVGVRIRVRIGYSVCLVSGYANVFILYFASPCLRA